MIKPQKRNGFGVAKMPPVSQPTGHAPRRNGVMQAPDPHPQIDRDARRARRRAQRAARSVTRVRS